VGVAVEGEYFIDDDGGLSDRSERAERAKSEEEAEHGAAIF
jgi:hypothetical protein